MDLLACVDSACSSSRLSARHAVLLQPSTRAAPTGSSPQRGGVASSCAVAPDGKFTQSVGVRRRRAVSSGLLPQSAPRDGVRPRVVAWRTWRFWQCRAPVRRDYYQPTYCTAVQRESRVRRAGAATSGRAVARPFAAGLPSAALRGRQERHGVCTHRFVCAFKLTMQLEWAE
jgi:hypothetical protein